MGLLINSLVTRLSAQLEIGVLDFSPIPSSSPLLCPWPAVILAGDGMDEVRDVESEAGKEFVF